MRFAFLLILVTAAAGCADASVRKGMSAECRNTSDCPAGLMCSRGICEDVNPALHCRDDDECPTGEDCVSGYCEAPRGTRTPPQSRR